MTGIMTQLRICAGAAAVLALAGCASTSTPATGPSATGPATASTSVPATGLLTGRFVREGGPLGPGGQQPAEIPLRGTVTFISAGHRAVSVQVGASGRVSVTLLPGQYQVAGRSPGIETVDPNGRQQEQACSQPLSAIVTAGHTITIAVTCVVP
ncbi:MAG: hypothetical protein ACRDOB_09385 [Streptosporangiaceae bacterium]